MKLEETSGSSTSNEVAMEELGIAIAAMKLIEKAIRFAIKRYVYV